MSLCAVDVDPMLIVCTLKLGGSSVFATAASVSKSNVSGTSAMSTAFCDDVVSGVVLVAILLITVFASAAVFTGMRPMARSGIVSLLKSVNQSSDGALK